MLKGALVMSLSLEEISQCQGALSAQDGALRLRLGRQSVNLLPVPRMTKTFTFDIIGRTWVVGREFESHVKKKHFLKRLTFLMSRI